MRIEELIQELTEGLSPVLFHAVPSKKWNAMAKKNPPVLFTSNHLNKYRVVSFSRNRSNRFLFTDHSDESGIDLVRDLTIVLEFDGRKFAERYKGKSIDPYAPQRDEDFYDPEELQDYTKNPEWDAMEDRLIAGRRMEIPFKPQWVRGLHLILPQADLARANYLDWLFDALPDLRRRYRVVKVYDTAEAYAVGRDMGF